jgi:hypothetical protein
MRHVADFFVGLFLLLIYPAIGFGLASVKYAAMQRWDWFMVGLGPCMLAVALLVVAVICYGITQLGHVVRKKLRPVRY